MAPDVLLRHPPILPLTFTFYPSLLVLRIYLLDHDGPEVMPGRLAAMIGRRVVRHDDVVRRLVASMVVPVAAARLAARNGIELATSVCTR